MFIDDKAADGRIRMNSVVYRAKCCKTDCRALDSEDG